MLEFLEDTPKSCLIFVVLFETNWDMEGCLFAGSPLHLISRMIVRTHYDIRISQRSQSSPGNAMVLWMSVFKEPRCILLREWFCMRILPVTLIFLLDSGTAVVWLVVRLSSIVHPEPSNTTRDCKGHRRMSPVIHPSVNRPGRSKCT